MGHQSISKVTKKKRFTLLKSEHFPIGTPEPWSVLVSRKEGVSVTINH